MSSIEIENQLVNLNEENTDTPTSDDPTAPTGFAALGLSPALVEAVERAGYTEPTPIQAQTIPLLLEGRDCLGQAQTGTGKTAAFALPLLDRLDTSVDAPQVLVLTPTRELAIQVAESFEKYAKQMRGLRVVPIYGGQDYQIQFRQLQRGPQVVVGTPGRVMDHMRRGSLDLKQLQVFVLDEADEMLRMGFADDVQWVLDRLPKQRQMALFSATMPPPIRHIANQHLDQPAQVTIKQETATADTIHQRYIVASPRQKQAALTRILEVEPTDGVLIFVRTRSATEPLAEHLARQGLKTAALNGDVAQSRRERIVDSLRAGRIDVIVATDVAARGLDVQRISHVINYDLPHDSEAYVHRIGRTGRAGRSGEAILFVHPKEKRMLKRLEYATRQTIEPMKMPSNRELNKRRVAQFHERITEAVSHAEIEKFQSIVEQYRRENDIPLELIAAALATMANGEKPLLVNREVEQASFAEESRYDKRRDRGAPHKGRGNRNRHSESRPRDDSDLETYRVEVGRSHSVQPGNLVGAIANEANLESNSIGKIKIYDRHSTVDLPGGMSSDLLSSLGEVFVVGQKLRISRCEDSAPRPAAPRRSGKKHYGKRKPKGNYSKRASSDA